jgi:hypothetical protein
VAPVEFALPVYKPVPDQTLESSKRRNSPFFVESKKALSYKAVHRIGHNLLAHKNN